MAGRPYAELRERMMAAAKASSA